MSAGSYVHHFMKEQRMKRARVGIIAAAVFAVAAVAFAQAKPDFSGTWTLDPDASGMAGTAGTGAAPAGTPPAGTPPAGAPPAGAQGGGRGGGGGALGNGGTIKQTADTLTIERQMGDNKVTLTYKLDGTESKNTMMGRGGTPMESVSVAKFDGGKLVITTKAGENETTQTWSLAGSVLTVESTGGRGPQKRVYKKTT
jgi:hypothetical protein